MPEPEKKKAKPKKKDKDCDCDKQAGGQSFSPAQAAERPDWGPMDRAADWAARQLTDDPRTLVSSYPPDHPLGKEVGVYDEMYDDASEALGGAGEWAKRQLNGDPRDSFPPHLWRARTLPDGRLYAGSKEGEERPPSIPFGTRPDGTMYVGGGGAEQSMWDELMRALGMEQGR